MSHSPPMNLPLDPQLSLITAATGRIGVAIARSLAFGIDGAALRVDGSFVRSVI
jgi:hypothetical protein